MVHTLNEIKRVLVPNGILIDLRPILDRWHIEVVSTRETQTTGRVQDYPLGLADDAAANKAMSTAEENKWFVRENEEFFPIIYVWDSANELEEWIHDEWDEFIGRDEETRRATRSAWALGDGDSRVHVMVNMLVTRWTKIK
ncbi:MAG TPA: hypothetical protein VJ972_01450, partial [Anaerolineales bacterium]|nr:hypothetical protein [Anaerolineales bacterium]